MIYLDYGATSFHKPPAVYRAAERAMRTCANPGRGGYGAAMEAAKTVFDCRMAAAESGPVYCTCPCKCSDAMSFLQYRW